MKKVEVKNLSGVITHLSICETLEEANEWIAGWESHEKPFGYKTKQDYTVDILDESQFMTVEDRRKMDYHKEGVTTDIMIVALWEKIVENRPQLANELQAKRETTKTKLPKS